MKYSLQISLVLAITVSFVLGWQLNTTHVDELSAKPLLEAPASNESMSVSNEASAIVIKAVGEQEPKGTQTLQPNSEKGNEERERAKAGLDMLDQQLKNGEFVEDLENQLDEFIDILKGIGFQDHWTNGTGIISQIINSPELYKAFLDRFSSLSEEDQLVFSYSLLDPNSPAGKFRENYIVEKLKAGEHTSTWLRALGEQGIRESSTFDYLIDQIDYLTAPDDLAAVINATSSISETSFNSSQLAMPTKDGVAELYEPFFDSQDEAVRTAALGTLVAYPRENEIELLERAFVDESPGFRQKALEVLMTRPIKVMSLQTLLYGIIRNENESRTIRRSAAIALQNNATVRPPQDVIDIANQLFRERRQ